MGIVGFVLAAAISFASAQEGPLFTAALEQDTAGAGGAALALAPEEGFRVNGAMVEEAPSPAVVVAQTPPLPGPAVTSDAAAVTTGKTLLNERAWSDGYTTIVECTGDVTRTCQVNVYGPNVEFILGCKISPNGEAADCSRPAETVRREGEPHALHHGNRVTIRARGVSPLERRRSAG